MTQPLKLIIGDRGAYSLENLRLFAQNGAIRLIGATRNIKKHNLVRLSKNLILNRDFVPQQWTDEELRKLFGIRTCIERLFPYNTLVCNTRRVNIQGIAEVSKPCYMILCLDLLKTIACHNLGRGDLFQPFTTFFMVRNSHVGQMLKLSLMSQGYALFPEKQEGNNRLIKN
ncbi:hypothetical protein [Candidatus Harpocratesius sp.]